jgi:2-methylisocitrate lyase-like PEP mutase family enzyme
MAEDRAGWSVPAHADRAREFAALHRPGAPLLLPNAWDVASAAALVAAGFPAIGTTSLGVAAAAGQPDGVGVTRAATVELAVRLRTVRCLLSVDIEGGFAPDPDGVAAVAAQLAELGVVGVNIEDGRADGTLAPVAHQQAVITAVKRAAPALFVNARTDTYWLTPAGWPTPQAAAGAAAETLDRLRAYRAAGADGVFVPGLADPATIARLVSGVDAPLNVLYLPGRHTPAELAGLGVARVSCGSLLFRAALAATVRTATAVRDGNPVPADLPSYAEVAALIDGLARAGG